jgi:hypothetical protein
MLNDLESNLLDVFFTSGRMLDIYLLTSLNIFTFSQLQQAHMLFIILFLGSFISILFITIPSFIFKKLPLFITGCLNFTKMLIMKIPENRLNS